MLLAIGGPVAEPLAVLFHLHFYDRAPGGLEAVWKVLLILIVVVPIWVYFWALPLGGILAAIEGWTFMTGVNFCLGVMTGSTVGLTTVISQPSYTN